MGIRGEEGKALNKRFLELNPLEEQWIYPEEKGPGVFTHYLPSLIG